MARTAPGSAPWAASTSGRQRSIQAGAPAFNQTALNGFEEAYLGTVDFRADGSVILPASKLDMLHAAVIAKCADEGIGNGTVQDPDACDFDPVALRCPDDENAANCLTGEQVTVGLGARKHLVVNLR